MHRSTTRALAEPLMIVALSALFACKSSSGSGGDGGTMGGKDAQSSDGSQSADAGASDATAPDAAPPSCLRDQGGAANRGCDPGQVCNLTMNPPQCVPGHACHTDADCDTCSKLMNPIDCGHGFHVTSFCDASHGNVCTRSRSPCEPCDTDRDCGRIDPQVGSDIQLKCLDYGTDATGNPLHFCGRGCALGCPHGFTCDPNTQQCKRDTCDPNTVICPAKTAGQMCTGIDQVCPNHPCPTGGNCVGDELPGSLGMCIGTCNTNADCAMSPSTPICNMHNGLCIAGCSKASCAGGQVCHQDGMCHPPCMSNMDCTTMFGANSYCNLPAGQPPDIYKNYRDDNSCAPLGCERTVDCVMADHVCDMSMMPPACVAGCYGQSDCMAGETCKSTGGQPPMMSYTRAQCQALPSKASATELGVCCDQGCSNRVLNCPEFDFCCGESGSPYQDPMSCGTAQSGDCFPMPAAPWCHKCMMSSECMSNFQAGFNTDPMINGGNPFQEQEWCITPTMGIKICNVTCKPPAMAGGENTCPAGWTCAPFYYYCLQDSDCGAPGITCVGAMPMANPPVPGRCKCGQGGTTMTPCPAMVSTLDQMVQHPRCYGLNPTGDMFCIASFDCQPPAVSAMSYPAACQ
jgi:hypothetical protein